MIAIDPHPDPVTVDVVVLGAGPAGEVAAERLSRAGLVVMTVEEALVGGECAYAACIPSKALLRGPAALEAATRVEGARESVSGPVDAAATLRRRTRFTNGWRDESQVRWLDTANVRLRRGHARLVAERQIEVSGADGDREVFVARHAVVVAPARRHRCPRSRAGRRRAVDEPRGDPSLGGTTPADHPRWRAGRLRARRRLARLGHRVGDDRGAWPPVAQPGRGVRR
jgi:pyruvate/2-oxoglutarate dehydrogenase complex dihydrolipoamide dehydrogenase (E3) component